MMSWTDNEEIPDQASKAPPALAAFQGRLHMVHLGDSSNDLFCRHGMSHFWILDNRRASSSVGTSARNFQMMGSAKSRPYK